MMRVRVTVSMVGVLALGGCMKPNPLLYTLGEDTTDSESDGEEDSGEEESGQTMPADMPDGEVCEPLEPFEAGCGECLALGCCDVALACVEVEQCPCLANCLLAGGSNNSCRSECGNVKPKDVAELDPLLECAIASCEQECGA